MYERRIDTWVDDGPPVVVDAALLEWLDELDAFDDPEWVAGHEAAFAEESTRHLAAHSDWDSRPLSVEEFYVEGSDWPPCDGVAALHETITDQQRQIARTRALLAGAVSDRDDAHATVEALRSRLGQAQDAVAVARNEVRVARRQVELARAETVSAVGERDLARADLTHAVETGVTRPEAGQADAPQNDAEQSDADVTGQGLVAGLAHDPGPALATVLEALVGDLALTPGSGPAGRVGCLDGLGEDEVVEVVTAARRLAGWANAVQVSAAGHLRDRYAGSLMAGQDEALWFTAAEIALASGLTRHAAVDILNVARYLPVVMPRIYGLFAAGRLDLAKAVLVTARTQHLDPDVARVVEAGIVDVAAGLTWPKLEALLDRLIAKALPRAEEDNARDARARRGVRFRALAYGMGQLSLTAGAEDIEACRAALNDLAHAARQASRGTDDAGTGDTGSATRARGRLDDPDNPHAPCDPDGRHPAATRAGVLVDLITGATEPADAAGDPTAHSAAGAVVAHADDRADAADRADACDCADVSDRAGDADRADTADPAGATDTAGTAETAGATAADETASTITSPAAATGASLKPASSRDRRRRTEIVVLVPLSVLTGASEQPATLAGYGPIPAQLARELATNGTWRCAAVDDREGSSTHGTLLGLGRSTYTPAYSPGPGLRRFIEIRDGECVFPGCRYPARRCELDHRTPWTDSEVEHETGATCDCNLHALCRHHHRLKHRGGFTARPLPGGGTTWTTPTGRTYTTRPQPLT